MEHPRFLILHGGLDARFAFEEFLSKGPYEILFAQSGMDGLKISRNAKAGVGTAELQLRDVHGIAGLEISSTGRMEAKLVVADSAATLKLTDSSLKFDVVGRLENAGQKADLRETSCRSADSQSHWKVWLESFLEANCGNPDLSFADVSRKFGCSRSYGCRMFKQQFGKTFREKLREIRIARATRLIADTRMHMYEVATECGFRSPNRFCEAFKRIHGVSPVEYRNRNFKKD